MLDEEMSKPLSLAPAPPLEEPQSSRSSSLASGVFRSAPVSPYLDYDSRFLQQTQPEFIFPEGANKQRGRFELAFSQIGSSVMVGAAIGGCGGFFNGMRATNTLNLSGKLWRTHMINHVMKQGSGTANTLGVMAVLYSAFGVLFQHVRGEDDHINTMAAGTATGLLYKSTGGLRKCAIGGGVGFSITALYCLLQWARSKSSHSPSFKYI